MKKEKVKTGFWIDKELMESIDELIPKANVDSRNEYVTKAIKFYNGFLRTERAETYLLSSFSSMIDGTIGGTEDRLSRLMYKLTVEVAMQNRILAYDHEITKDEIVEIREDAENEVREIIGYWSR